MENQINNNKRKEYNYVYFIESHEKGKTSNILLSKRHPGVQDLEAAYSTLSDNDYLVTIYRFRIFSEIIYKNNKNPQKLEFTITLIDSNKDKFKKVVSNLVMHRDNFFFDFKFPNIGIFNNISPPKSLNQTLTEQFNYYLNYLKKSLNCKKESDEINNLVLSIQKYIFDKDLKYDFSLYLTIFLECHKQEAILRHLNLFKVEKIKEKGELSNEKMEEINNVFNTYITDPDKTKFNHTKIKNKEIIEEYKIKLFSVILYYNYNFNKESLNILNDNKEINKYLYRGLYKFTPLFKESKLPKDQIQEIINASNNFNELKNGLEYSLNVKDLLQSIFDRIDKFNNCYTKAKKEYKKEKNIKLRIEIGEIVTPNINDNLKDISDLIHKIYGEIKKSELEFYLIFDSPFFIKYINFYQNRDLDNLLIILELIKLLKSNYDLTEAQICINKSINETGNFLGSNKKLRNIQILNCIKNDINYNSNSKYIKDQKCFDIFNSLDFELIDNEFKEINKTINWINIFGKEYPNFIVNICGRINHIKYFNSLFVIFNINFKHFNMPNEYKFILIKTLQYKYLELTKRTYKPEICPNFFEDSANLVYFTDQYGENVEGLLHEMNDDLPEDTIYEIYMKLLTIYKKLSKKTENIVVKFILNKKNRNRESYIVLYLLERCQDSKELISSNFDFYLINEEEIFQEKESENMKLLKGLLNNEIFTTQDDSLNKYINHTKTTLNNIIIRIQNNEINYCELEPFFTNKKTEQNLYNRLLIIYLNDINLAKEANNKIKINFNNMKNAINDLEDLVEDKKFFFINSQKDNIIKLEELIKSIKERNYNFFKEKENEINELINPSKNEIRKRTYMRKCTIFLKIYDKQKEMHPNDEIKRIEESNNEINKYKPFLIGQKKNNIDIELSKIIKSVNLNKESINKIADELITLFELEEKAYKKQIIISLMSLAYKDKLLKIVTSLKQIIELAKVKKGEFYKILDIIKPFLEKKEISISIDFSIRVLQNYSINIFDEEDNLIKLLIKLNEFPEIIQNLLEGNLDEITKKNLIGRKTIDTFEQTLKFLRIFQEKDKISELEDLQLIEKIRQEMKSPK